MEIILNDFLHITLLHTIKICAVITLCMQTTVHNKHIHTCQKHQICNVNGKIVMFRI